MAIVLGPANIVEASDSFEASHSSHVENRSNAPSEMVVYVETCVDRTNLHKCQCFKLLIWLSGGRGGIRTHGTLAGTPVFKTGALNHSATLPNQQSQSLSVACFRTQRERRA